jgi:hypothetical protein
MMEKIKKNLGLSLFVLNLLLFLVFLFLNDPFHLLSKTYEKAPKLLDLRLSEIQKIRITFPDKSLEYQIEILNAPTKFKNLEEYIQNLSGRVIINQQEYELDKENLKSFIETLQDLKRYYEIPDTQENRSMAGINEKSAKIIIEYKNQKQDELKIGYVSIRNNSSYVQLNKENKIYQVEYNLKIKSGYEDVDYFRNHSIFNIDKNKVQKIALSYKNNRYVYAKAAKDWQLIEPKPAKLQNTAMEGIVEEIVNFKATKFYNTQKPQDKDWEALNLTIELDISQDLEATKKEIFMILGRKSYVKYLVLYKDNYYEVSAYRIEDLLEPDKLIEKK